MLVRERFIEISIVINDPSHRGGDARSLVNSVKVVVSEVQSQRGLRVRPLLTNNLYGTIHRRGHFCPQFVPQATIEALHISILSWLPALNEILAERHSHKPKRRQADQDPSSVAIFFRFWVRTRSPSCRYSR